MPQTSGNPLSSPGSKRYSAGEVGRAAARPLIVGLAASTLKLLSRCILNVSETDEELTKNFNALSAQTAPPTLAKKLGLGSAASVPFESLDLPAAKALMSGQTGTYMWE